jgi:tetratricopeptide (TPR) repeat protein
MRSAGIAAGLFFVFSTLCLPQAALAQSDRPPFPKDESARLGAEIRKDPENDLLRRQLIDLLRPFGRTLKQPPENIYKLITSAAALQDSKRPGDLEKAVGLLKRAANSAAWYVDIYLNLALAYDEAQNWAQAKRYYELFLYAGKDYSFVSAEIGIMEEALRRVEGELAKGGRR